MRGGGESFRRGMALPLALLAVLVIGLLSGLILRRFGAQALTVHRQVEFYERHHLGRGLQEGIHAWLGSASNPATLRSRLREEDGFAFDMELSDGAVISVYFRDGQGRLLGEKLALSSSQASGAAAAYNELIDLVPPARFDDLTRAAGPPAVSVATAEPEVLQALANALLRPTERQPFLRELYRARDDGSVGQDELTEAAAEAGLSPESRVEVNRMLVAEPTLWTARVEIRGRGGELLRLFEGDTLLEEPQEGEQGGVFLTFDELPVE